MPALRDIQLAYLRYYETGEMPAQLIDAVEENQIPANTRLEIYHYTTFMVLKSTLESTFNRVKSLLGNELFNKTAGAFIHNHIPNVSLLDNWGAEYPEFIRDIGISHNLPHLNDVAKFEWLLHQAYIAADVAAIDGAALANYPPEQLVETSFTLAPAIQLFSSNYNIQAVMEENGNGLNSESFAVITRPFACEIHWIPQEMHNALQTLRKGSTLLEISQLYPTLDIQDFLIFLTKNKALKAVTSVGERNEQ